MVFARYKEGELLKLYCLEHDEYHDYAHEIRRMNDVYTGIGYNSVTNVYWSEMVSPSPMGIGTMEQ